MGTHTTTHGRPAAPRAHRRQAALKPITVLRLLLLTGLALALLIAASGPAWADETTTTTVAAAATEEAPTLDYTFTWPTFVLSFGLVIGYYIFVFKMSEKEFKGVVAERFGPKSSEGGAA